MSCLGYDVALKYIQTHAVRQNFVILLYAYLCEQGKFATVSVTDYLMF